MTRTLGLIALLSVALACGRSDSVAASDAASTVTANAPGAPVAVASPPPANAQAFLIRFCDAVAKGEQTYVAAHAAKDFSSAQAPDPDAPNTAKRGKRTWGLAHANESAFAPTCTRVRAQPPAELAQSVRVEGATTLVRLRSDGLASDLFIERQGNDFRLLREAEPRGKLRAPPTSPAPRGGGGW